MPDYKAMYFKLFNQLQDIVELLQKAHQEAEEAYLEEEDGEEAADGA